MEFQDKEISTKDSDILIKPIKSNRKYKQSKSKELLSEFNQEETKDSFIEFINLNRKKILKSIDSYGNCEIDLTELKELYPKLFEYILYIPDIVLPLFNMILYNDVVFELNQESIKLINFPEQDEKFIRDIRSSDINTLICTEALIRQVTNVKSIAKNIRYECPSCGTIFNITQKGDTISFPNSCSCGRKGNFKQLDSDNHDIQIMSIEEKHEDIENNHQPERIKMFLEGSLTDKEHTINHIPGTAVKVIGIVREELKYVRGNNISRISEKNLEINNISYVEDNFSKIQIDDEDIEKIKEIANKDNTLDLIGQSIIPSVYGYESIKKSLSLMAFGGVKNKRSDGSFTRECIHGLLIGDAGLSKSVMLRAISSLMPRGRFTSGRGASGAGVTATVIKSEITGDYTVEGGSLIMANGSILAIDEAEKMRPEDITNIHEAMSLGTVSIDKATIHCVLPARTSVLAAANPKYGRFKNDTDVYSQISFPPSLLSRFDFIYVLKDIPNEKRDEMIANKILNEHMNIEEPELLSREFLKKYLFYAKQINPKLTKESNEKIMKFYLSLRKQSKETGNGNLVISITPRQIESLVRLSEAHARMKLHNFVTADDVLQAIKIFKEYLIEFGYDENSGLFDVDRIMGINKSKFSIIEAITKFMKMVGPEYYEGYIPRQRIEEEFKDKVDIKKFDDAFYQLNKYGSILKGTKGYKLLD